MAEHQDTSLPPEATMVTKELLEESLRNSEKKDDLVVENFDVRMATKPGENFLSVVFRVTVTATTGNGAVKSKYPLVVKVQHLGEESAKVLYANKTFFKDMQTYVQILPAMIEVAKEKTSQPMVLSTAKYYGGLLNEKNAVMILEDLCAKGYRLADATKGLDLEHCQLFMKEVAKFHALAYAIGKDPNAKRIEDRFGFVLHESILTDLFADKYSDFMKCVIYSIVELVRETKDDNAIKRMEKLHDSDIIQVLRDLYDPSHEFAMICHGDLWETNMMFKYGEDGLPTSVSFFDFQVIRYAPPTTDLSMFFYMATSPSFRRLHLKDLLRLYHTSFMDCLKQVKLELPGFTYDEFIKLFYKYNLVGILCSLTSLPLTKAKPEDVVPMDSPVTPELHQQIQRALKNGGHQKWILDTVYEAIENLI